MTNAISEKRGKTLHLLKKGTKTSAVGRKRKRFEVFGSKIPVTIASNPQNQMIVDSGKGGGIQQSTNPFSKPEKGASGGKK